MGLRFRRSVKIAPGLRLNFNKNSMGLTMGPRGAHYTINTSGRTTASLGLPGTGLWFQESSGGGRRRTNNSISQVPPGTPLNNRGEPLHLDSPGIFASRGERAFYEFASNYLNSSSKKPLTEIRAVAEKIKSEIPENANYIDFTLIGPIAAVKAEEALPLCERLYKIGPELFDHSIAMKYFDEFQCSIPIARGIRLKTSYDYDYLNYSYSEILQAVGQPEKALEVIEKTGESEYKEIAVLDLYLVLKRYDEVITMTEDESNEDDASAIKLIFRAIALRESGQPEVALEALKLAISKRSRSSELINFALYERACTYEKLGKKANAIKDLTKILVKDYDDQAAKAKLKELQ